MKRKKGAPKDPVEKHKASLENELRRELHGACVAREGQFRVVEIGRTKETGLKRRQALKI